MQSVYYFRKAPLYPPPLNLLTFIPSMIARWHQQIYHNREKQHGFDIFDAVDQAYERDSTNKHVSRERTRKRIVSQYFKHHTNRELEDIKRRDEEAERLELNKASKFDLLTVKGQEVRFNKIEKLHKELSGRIHSRHMDATSRMDKLQEQMNEMMGLVQKMEARQAKG